MSNRTLIIDTIIKNFKQSFNTANGFMDVVRIDRGSIFSDQSIQLPSLFIMFISDTPSEGDYLGDETATRLLTLELQVGINTSSNNYEKYEQIMDKCEEFLRSDFIDYDIILGAITRVEGDKDIQNSFFGIQFSIFYDRQY